ncbi:1,2-phenylacetyl-CoA epoxidase subunit PaaD [Streptomyces pseudogriseolus]|uniref:1,2-phenylacetyl-CoA epoxidase subunit PaaD n=1 Tax=Streptomyces pseudogriseolus TaxID=36817 RepID=UPI003FA1C88D
MTARTDATAPPGDAPVAATAPRLDAARVRVRVKAVPDPELPMITLGDLGVVSAVTTADDGTLTVELTPTFLGCPALPAITAAVQDVLEECGHPDGRVRQVLTPAWSTDRITPEGRAKLAAHGIAPPSPAGAASGPVRVDLGVPCPHCGSRATRPHSSFGPTRCQSMLRCTACRETFPSMTAI